MSVVIYIIGDKGAGKTWLGTYMAIRSNKKIIASNFPIIDSRYVDLQPIMLHTLRDAVVVMDEPYVWLESRTSGNKLNEFLSYEQFQSRKKGCDYILMTQIKSTVDLRFREMADILILAYKVDGNNDFHYRVTRNSLTNPKTGFFRVPAKKRHVVYDFYNTDKEIAMKQDVLDSAILDRSTILPEVDLYVNQLLEKNSLPNVIKAGKAGIESWCMRRKISKMYSDMIWRAIKEKTLQ